MKEQISLLMLWMDVHMSQQSNLKMLTRKTYNNSLIQQPNYSLWFKILFHVTFLLGQIPKPEKNHIGPFCILLVVYFSHIQ